MVITDSHHRTGSNPPWLHGLQRSRRQPASAPPANEAFAAQRVDGVLRAGRVVLARRREERAERERGRATIAATTEPVHQARPPSSCASTSSPLAEPLEAVRRDRLRQARPHDQHVVVARPARARAARCQTSRSCRLILLRSTAPPTARRHGEAEARRGRLLLRKPVENEEARRHRAAVAIDRVEVPRAGQTVRAFHDSSLRGRERYAERRARPLSRRRLRIDPAGPRRHAGTKAVLALAAADVGLVGALHECEKSSRKAGKFPASGGERGGQYRRRSSTDFSTGARGGAMRE